MKSFLIAAVFLFCGVSAYAQSFEGPPRVAEKPNEELIVGKKTAAMCTVTEPAAAYEIANTLDCKGQGEVFIMLPMYGDVTHSHNLVSGEVVLCTVGKNKHDTMATTPASCVRQPSGDTPTKLIAEVVK